MDDYEKKFGQRVKAARRKAGMSREELAGKLFVCVGTIKSWEWGERTPKLYTACELAKVLKVSVGWLVAGEVIEK